MVADPKTSCLGLEYFCFEGDDLWASSKEDLIDLGKRELAALGLADPSDVIDAAVVRMKKAYPVYDRGYDGAVATVRAFLAALPNLQLVGRNGMHRYNNQDHSMLTAMLRLETSWEAATTCGRSTSTRSTTKKDARSVWRSSARWRPRNLSCPARSTSKHPP